MIIENILEDIQAGDLLYCKDGNVWSPQIVTQINTYPNIGPEELRGSIVTAGGYGYQRKHIMPIFISKEILELNGFHLNENNEYEFRNSEILIQFSLPSVRIKKVNSQTEINAKDCCRYIHHFQHLLKIANVKFNIKVPRITESPRPIKNEQN